MFVSLNKDVLYLIIEKTICKQNDAKLRYVSRVGMTCKKLFIIAQNIIKQNTYIHNFYLLSKERPDIIILDKTRKICIANHIHQNLWLNSIKTSTEFFSYLFSQDYIDDKNMKTGKIMIHFKHTPREECCLNANLMYKGYPSFDIVKYLLFNKITIEWK